MSFFDLDKLFGDKENFEPVLIQLNTLYKTLELCLEDDFEVDIDFEYKKQECRLGTKKSLKNKIALYLEKEEFENLSDFKSALEDFISEDGGFVHVKNARKYFPLF